MIGWALYLAYTLLLPPLLIGLLRKLKSRLQGRQGPPVWQVYRDLAKLARKGETISETTTWVFAAAPSVALGCVLVCALSVPWLGLPAPLHGDVFLLVYLLALGKFAMSLAALDPGTTFGALGASREAAVGVLAEPALVLALAALAVQAGSSDLAVLFASRPGAELGTLLPLVGTALWLSITAELARMPVDDPTTHLELTMIHEALILENSGRNLALVELGAGIKLAVLFGLLAQVLLMGTPALAPWAAHATSLALIVGACAVVAFIETVMVRLRWRRIPALMAFGLTAATMACLIVALKSEAPSPAPDRHAPAWHRPSAQPSDETTAIPPQRSGLRPDATLERGGPARAVLFAPRSGAEHV
ncbi:MAG: NADH-quinone oxidoreductase subunit H [Armatimonadetes bacterium]|nr:NADH-quinone oxidoreductase subunit H [Armatimonadota bacterium]